MDDKKVVLSGTEQETSHNRMELLGIIRSIDFLREENLMENQIHIFTDSQYAVKLRGRKERLAQRSFTTKKGQAIRNSDLVQQLLQYDEMYKLLFTKVKAHSKDGDRFNREVDLLVRTQLRQITKYESSKHE